MRAILKYAALCLLCVVLLIPSGCTRGGQTDVPSSEPAQTPGTTQPVESTQPSAPVGEEPGQSAEPIPTEEPVISELEPTVHPDEETLLSYDRDGITGTVPAVLHCNIHGYSIVYDALHYERLTYHEVDSYWSEENLYLSVSMVYGMTIDTVLDGLMLQENIEMAPETTSIGAGEYPAYTLYHVTEAGIFRQFWVMDYNGDTLLIEQSCPMEYEYADFHLAVQQAMLDSLTLIHHDAEAISAFQAVLEERMPVLPAAGGEAVTLSGYLAEVGELTETVRTYTAMTYCDLDGDETVELILSCAVNGQESLYDILRYHEGEIYLYEMPYRGLQQLKTDGTFFYSGSAFEYGIAVLSFSAAETAIVPSTYVTMGEEGEQLYFVDGEAAIAAAFNEAIDRQGQKNGVVWYAAG